MKKIIDIEFYDYISTTLYTFWDYYFWLKGTHSTKYSKFRAYFSYNFNSRPFVLVVNKHCPWKDTSNTIYLYCINLLWVFLFFVQLIKNAPRFPLNFPEFSQILMVNFLCTLPFYYFKPRNLNQIAKIGLTAKFVQSWVDVRLFTLSLSFRFFITKNSGIK